MLSIQKEVSLRLIWSSQARKRFNPGLQRRGIMEITDIRVRKVTGGGKPKAYVTVTFDDCFVVHNIKIIEGKTGIFIAMPSRKTRAGEYKDVAHPIHPEFRAELQKRILDKYESGDVDVAADEADD